MGCDLAWVLFTTLEAGSEHILRGIERGGPDAELLDEEAMMVLQENRYQRGLRQFALR